MTLETVAYMSPEFGRGLKQYKIAQKGDSKKRDKAVPNKQISRGRKEEASERDRTSDLLITNQPLYRLSYAGATRREC